MKAEELRDILDGCEGDWLASEGLTYDASRPIPEGAMDLRG